MHKLFATLAAAFTLAWAGSAGAAVMIASMTGGWNNDPNWTTWTLEVAYDTDGMILDDGVAGQERWFYDTAPGPTLYVKGVFNGFDENGAAKVVTLETTDVTSIEILRGFKWHGASREYEFNIEGPGYFLRHFGGPVAAPGFAIDRPISAPVFGSPGSGGDLEIGEPVTDYMSIIRAPVPEPATWAMMIVGFGLAGLGLRRDQRSFQGA